MCLSPAAAAVSGPRSAVKAAVARPGGCARVAAACCDHWLSSLRMERPQPGQALALRILLLPNPSRENGAEWRVSEVVKYAADTFGVTSSHDSVSSSLRLRLSQKGLVQSRKAGKGSTLFSLTAEVGSARGRDQGFADKRSLTRCARRPPRRAGPPRR